MESNDAFVMNFETHPDRYKHWALTVDGDQAELRMTVEEEGGLKPGYVLKLNSYDLGVDIELADAIRRLRFEHPQVRVCTLTGGLDRMFCAGANIVMLRTSTHAWKVNFCKFTNETRCELEDASANSGIKFLAALNGHASGGGYELALAADRILLVDDRSSAVSFPEVPLLGVLPGTGGLTRLVDKRKIRRDRSDVFSTMAEGIKGQRALKWGLVDAIAPLSKFEETTRQLEEEMLAENPERSGVVGVALGALDPTINEDGIAYRHVALTFADNRRTAEMTLTVPDNQATPTTGDEAHTLGDDWWAFRMFRELDDMLLRLRVNHPELGLVSVKTRGSINRVLEMDATLKTLSDHWFVREVQHFIKRTLKRMDVTAKSFFSIIDEGSCFAGTLLEVALAGDRTYILNDPDFPVELGISELNRGDYPMANGLSRLETRFLGEPEQVGVVTSELGVIDALRADDLGLATSAPDELDWEDELRVALEERASFSPDALTGMEANLRFAGPETLETKIFGRLTAWQNWIFQRPNAVGPRGALQCYGTPTPPEFNYDRT